MENFKELLDYLKNGKGNEFFELEHSNAIGVDYISWTVNEDEELSKKIHEQLNAVLTLLRDGKLKVFAENSLKDIGCVNLENCDTLGVVD